MWLFPHMTKVTCLHSHNFMKFVEFEIDKIIFEKGKQRLGEFIKCPNCQQYINLEVNIYRDKNNNIYCKKCNTQIGEKERGINEE